MTNKQLCAEESDEERNFVLPREVHDHLSWTTRHSTTYPFWSSTSLLTTASVSMLPRMAQLENSQYFWPQGSHRHLRVVSQNLFKNIQVKDVPGQSSTLWLLIWMLYIMVVKRGCPEEWIGKTNIQLFFNSWMASLQFSSGKSLENTNTLFSALWLSCGSGSTRYLTLSLSQASVTSGISYSWQTRQRLMKIGRQHSQILLNHNINKQAKPIVQ